MFIIQKVKHKVKRPSHPLESRDSVCLLSELAAGSQLRKQTHQISGAGILI